MEYQVCEANTIDTLHYHMKKYICVGWRPIGGVSVVYLEQTEEWKYYQAMIREGVGS